MTTITIPKNLIKDDLVIISRREYENLLKKKKKEVRNKITVKHPASFRVPKKHEKFYKELDKELMQILRECEEGKCSDAFETIEELKHSLSR